MKYAGSDWLEKSIKHIAPKCGPISPFGKDVADLLGELFCGIYHIDNRSLAKARWDNNYVIFISIGYKDWSTYDSANLTRLVFLAHHMAIRVELQPSRYGYMRILFHLRTRSGNSSERHPTLDEAVENFKKYVSLPEHKDGGQDEVG